MVDEVRVRAESGTPETFRADLSGIARVLDGDTIEIDSVRIRLWGIDAPEGRQSCLAGSRRWPCGRRATQALARQIDGRLVGCEERDRDGRIVAVCRHGAREINAWLVREGWALAYRWYSRAYVEEEWAAKASRRGLWLREGMSSLALVETRLALHAQLRAFHPLEHEQRAFDAPDLAERQIQAILLAVGAELAQHCRRFYGHGFDTGRQPQGVVPVLEHDLLVDRLAHEGGEFLPPPRSAEARQPAVGKVAQTRREREAEQVEQGEDVVGDAASVDMVHKGVELGCVSH